MRPLPSSARLEAPKKTDRETHLCRRLLQLPRLLTTVGSLRTCCRLSYVLLNCLCTTALPFPVSIAQRWRYRPRSIEGAFLVSWRAASWPSLLVRCRAAPAQAPRWVLQMEEVQAGQCPAPLLPPLPQQLPRRCTAAWRVCGLQCMGRWAGRHGSERSTEAALLALFTGMHRACLPSRPHLPAVALPTPSPQACNAPPTATHASQWPRPTAQCRNHCQCAPGHLRRRPLPQERCWQSTVQGGEQACM